MPAKIPVPGFEPLVGNYERIMERAESLRLHAAELSAHIDLLVAEVDVLWTAYSRGLARDAESAGAEAQRNMPGDRGLRRALRRIAKLRRMLLRPFDELEALDLAARKVLGAARPGAVKAAQGPKPPTGRKG